MNLKLVIWIINTGVMNCAMFLLRKKVPVLERETVQVTWNSDIRFYRIYVRMLQFTHIQLLPFMCKIKARCNILDANSFIYSHAMVVSHEPPEGSCGESTAPPILERKSSDAIRYHD
jgi:hypothetical protein